MRPSAIRLHEARAWVKTGGSTAFKKVRVTESAVKTQFNRLENTRYETVAKE